MMMFSLARLLVATLGCARSLESWPVCAEEEEFTAADYAGYDEGLDDSDLDFLVCGPLPADGSACPASDDIDANAFFEENIGPGVARTVRVPLGGRLWPRDEHLRSVLLRARLGWGPILRRFVGDVTGRLRPGALPLGSDTLSR